MQQELYIDVLFLVNFMMDFFILLTLRRILKCPATYGRICAGAALGAVGACLAVIMRAPYIWVKLLVFHLVINTVMLKTGLKIRTWRQFARAMLLLYICGFLYGGMMESLHNYIPYIRTASLFVCVAIVSYLLVRSLLDWILDLGRSKKGCFQVILFWKEERMEVQAMLDTGNLLKDPYTGKGVNVIEKDKVEPLLAGWEERIPFRLIPYQAVGTDEGYLPAVTIDRMCICGKEDRWVERPVIAIWKGDLAGMGDCHMILNPGICSGLE